MKTPTRTAEVTALIVRNLEATLESLISRYNETESKTTYNQIRAVRCEIAEARQGR